MTNEVKFSFEASHVVGSGRCARLHGHTWRLTVATESKHQSDAVGIDPLLRKTVQKMVEMLDYQHLNFLIFSPTVYNTAMFITFHLRPMLIAHGIDDFIVHLEAGGEAVKVGYKETAKLDSNSGGWRSAFRKMVVFNTIEAQTAWIKQTRKQLYSSLRALDDAGQRLYSVLNSIRTTKRDHNV